jgi:glycerol dehydrogenase
MLDCMAHQVSDALTEVVLANIISAGYVTNLRARKNAAALAQAVCSGFDANARYLRGEILAYGILIMLTMEKRYRQRDELYAFSRSVGLPACLADLQADEAMLPAIAKRILSAMDDVSCTEAMLIDAILEAEEYDRQQKETEEPIEE